MNVPRDRSRKPSGDLDEARLDEALRSLPKTPAPEGFTNRVLSRLAEDGGSRQPARARSMDLGWALAAALAFAVAVVFIAGQRADDPAPGTSDRRARIEALRLEQQAIAAELDYLEHLADEDLEPVLVIRDGAQAGVLVDLAGAPPGGARPAAWSDQGSTDRAF